MPRSLRLILTPLPANADGTRQLFDGASVSCTVMGGGLSKASIGSSTAGKLSLQMTFLDRARSPQDTEVRALAAMSGSIALRDEDTAVFTGDATGWVLDPAADDQAPDGATSQRALRFEIASPEDAGEATSQDLLFKLDPTRFRYIEVRAKLEVGGSTESDFDVNGVLDIAITADNPPPLGVTIGVHPPLFDAIPATANLIVTPSEGDPITFPLVSGMDRGDGLLSFLVPSPQPGVTYTAEMQIRPSDPRTQLFQGFELNQLVAQSNGSSADPLSNLGADALVFELKSEPEDDEDAVQGGPDAPSDQQLASFDAQGGTVAVA